MVGGKDVEVEINEKKWCVLATLCAGKLQARITTVTLRMTRACSRDLPFVMIKVGIEEDGQRSICIFMYDGYVTVKEAAPAFRCMIGRKDGISLSKKCL